MALVGSVATKKLVGMLNGESGLPATVAAVAAQESVALAPIGAAQVVAQNVAAEVIERSTTVKYPLVHLYCDRVTNQLKEKFRTFSGTARMTVEARVSQDRLEGLERQLQLYVDSITKVLDESRGDWGDGMFYTGGYEVSFGPLKHGGKNFLQTAKIVFEVDASIK